ncbi:MAG TPA: 50S ribosomal protein L25 [Phycisphaerales bacterium]|nr:50S ribosomal protein L25 [Phycisphaerales bacterium]
MQGNTPVLSVSARERVGTRYARRARAQGLLPAVVYGHGAEPVPINVPAKETLTRIHRGEKVFQMSLPGEAAGLVLLKELQFDHLGTNIVHADFARVDLNERVHTRVHVTLTGEAPGLKTAGAILMHPTSELDIECLVTELPEHVEVSVAGLEVGQVIAAGDVTLPGAGMRLLTDPHAIVAQIVIQKEVLPAEATAVAADAAQPEVITAKKEEGAAAGAPAAGDKDKKGGGKDKDDKKK